jgi:hypothetical protein
MAPAAALLTVLTGVEALVLRIPDRIRRGLEINVFAFLREATSRTSN